MIQELANRSTSRRNEHDWPLNVALPRDHRRYRHIFISAADRSEPSHPVCAELLRSHSDIVVPATVVPEAAWLIEDRLGPQAEARFLRFVTSDLVQIVDLGKDDYERCIELIVEYEDLGLGLVDASIIAIGERLDISQIATLNRRDFAVVRPRHLDAFDLLP